jgi:hypothetical protein
MTTQLTPGLYTLSRDVANPSPDRRQKYDWRVRPTWTAGTEFYVETERFAERAGMLVMTLSHARFSHRLYEHEAKFMLLAAALVPVAMTPVQRLHVTFLADGSPRAYPVLERLVRDGVVTIEQVQATLAAMNAEYDAEETKEAR